MSSDLEKIISNLHSDKVKQRDAGVANLREYLSDPAFLDEAIATGQEDGRFWLNIYQALFSCVKEEKSGCVKKGIDNATGIALRRLETAASTVRWLVSLTAPHLSRKVVKVIFTHLIQMLEHKGTLLRPISLDYVKALRLVLSQPHHLESLELRDWEGTIKMCFAGVFDEDLKMEGFTEGEAEGEDLFLTGSQLANQRSNGNQDRGMGGSDEEDGDPSQAIMKKRKRNLGRGLMESSQRPSSSATPSSNRVSPSATQSRSSPMKPITKRTTSQDDLALISLVHTLLQSPSSAPLLSSTLCPPHLPPKNETSPLQQASWPPSYTASSILYKLLRFLHTFPIETSAHLDVLCSLNLVFSEIALNRLDVMRTFVWRLWPVLVGVWGKTKSREIREQVLIAWRVCYPFVDEGRLAGVGRGDQELMRGAEGESAELMGRVADMLDGEVDNRWGNEALSLESLKFGMLEGEKEAFVAGSFAFGQNFSAAQATAWAQLELHADVMSSLLHQSESSPFSSSASTLSTAKRRKIENPVSSLLSSIEASPTSQHRVFRLQLLLFLIDRHPTQLLVPKLVDPISKTLFACLVVSDDTVQSWAFICIAALALASSPTSSNSFSSSSTPSSIPSLSRIGSTASSAPTTKIEWDQLWTYTIRKITVPIVCRAAAHAAHSLLYLNLVPPTTSLVDIEQLLRDLEVQGPSFPYDSVCSFLSLSLDLVRRDVRLFRMELEDKVLGWLVTFWNVFDGTTKGLNAKSKLENHSPDDVLRLLTSICRLEKRVPLVYHPFLPDSPVVTHVEAQAESAVVRDWVLFARLRLPRTLPSSTTSSSFTSSSAPITDTSAMDLQSPSGRARKVSAFLLKSVESLKAFWSDADPESNATIEKIRRSVDLVVLAVCFEASLQVNGTTQNRRTIKDASYLVSAILPLLSSTRLSTLDMAVIIQGLEPLVQTKEKRIETRPALLWAGEAAGLKKELLPILDESKGKEIKAEEKLRSAMQRIVWQSSDLQDAFNPLLALLRITLKGLVGTRDEPVVQAGGYIQPTQGQPMEVDADDDFGPSLVAEEDKAAVVTNQADPSRPSRSIVALVRSVSSCLIRIPASQSGSNEPSRQEDLFDQLDECDPFRFVLFGSVLFEAVRLEHLHISASAADRVLEAFQEYFSAYSFSRDESMHLLAISFLEATSHLWLQPSVSEADFGVHVRLSCSYFIKNLELGKLRTGRIRARFLRFVELYLELDPTESFWKLPLGLEGNDKLLSARRFVIPLVRDVDVQVRFEAAVILPNLFNFVAKVERQPIPFYMSFYDEADVLGSTEQHVTTALLLANSIVVSAFVRKAAYFHLLEAFSNHPEASLFHLEIALRSAASALGLGSLFALWELYNPAVELQLHLLKQDGSIVPEVPASLLGYSNRKQNSDMVLRRFGAWLVGRGDHDRFLELCRASGKTDEEGYLECLPSSIACLLINPQESVKSSDFIKKVDRLIRLAGLDHSVAGYLNNSLDAILTACLAALIDADKIGSVLEKKQLDKFQQLSLPSYDSSHSMLLLAPRATPELIVRAFDWLIGNSGKDRMSDDAIASNVLFSLATRAGKTPLILEQTRIVYSISILISLFHSAFKNITILRSLLHLTTSLMTQRELVPIIHGFLRWGLARLPVTKVERSPGIDEVLVRIASLGQALQASSNPPDIVEIGSSLLGKLEEAVHKIVTEDHALRGQAQDALYLWPRPLSPELARCCPVQDASRLSRVLVNQDIGTAKFSLVKQYASLFPSFSPEHKKKFVAESFWHLKASIPSLATLSVSAEETKSFIDLLFLADGDLQPPSIAAIPSLPSSDRFLGPGVLEDRRIPSGVAARYCIIVGLAQMLGSERMELVDLAYQTLRNLNGATNDHDLSSIASYPSTFKPQINLLGKTPTSVKISTTYALKDIGKHVILTPSTTHERWLSDFSSYLASVLGREDAFFSLILPVLHASSDYASRLLPHLVKEVLLQRPSSGSPLPKPLLSSYLQSVLQQPSTAVEIKRSVIDIVLHLRHSTPEKDSSPLAYNEWLEIDYLLLADAAIHSRAYSTALLFLELGHEDSALERSEPENRILYEIYANIEDPDGFYGIKSHDVRSSLVRRFHHEKQWDRAFAFHGADVRYGGFSTGDQASSVTGVLQSLHSFGFDSMAMSFFDNTRSTKNGQRTMPTELGLDLAWRTGNWDLPIDLSASTIAQASGSSLYAALKAIHRERDPGVVQETIRSTIVSELSRMHSLGIESMTDLREVKTTLLCLREIERWSEGRMQEKLQGGELGDESPFRAFSEIFPFDDIEKIEAVRSSLLDSIPFDDLDAVSSSYKSVQQARKSSQLFLSERARDIGRSQVAINACTIAQKIDAESEPSLEVSYEFANVLWMQNEHGLAIDLLKQVIERSKVGGKGAKSAMKAGHLSQLGEWTSEAKLDTAERIRDQYFAQATNAISSTKESAEQGIVYRRYAVFAEQQLQVLDASPEIQRIRVYQERQNRELAELQQQLQEGNAGRSKRKSTSRQSLSSEATISSQIDKITRKQQDDESALKQNETAKSSFLRKAITSFAKALTISDEFDDDISRLTSLWIGHYRDDNLNTHIRASLQAIPSHKFTSLVMQISGRLDYAQDKAATPFQHNLQSLFGRLAVDHPFHSLLQLVTLRDGCKPSPDINARERQTNAGKPQSAWKRLSMKDVDELLESKGEPTGRSQAAEHILRQAIQKSPVIKHRFDHVNLYAKAAIQWSNAPNHHFSKNQKKRLVADPALALPKLRNLDMPIPSADLPVDKTCKYMSFRSLKQYRSEFRVAGGVHAPKIMTCIDSDGRDHEELFKSGDDIRQDFLMEQLFGVVNVLLQRDGRTRARALRYRTYNVVPLAQMSGTIEFVSNTCSYQEWVRPAQFKYNPDGPKDYGAVGVAIESRQKQIDRAQGGGTGPKEDKGRMFEAILKEYKIKPVMRHVFREKFRDPMAWFSSRLAYARSVAVTSIVGHLVGLGDRHASNILVDQTNGEFVHIDLGIAFDQGKELYVPEHVPFRLTANIVDGFGSSGVDGVFRRCCEETLRVTRERSVAILTILQVLKHDPLSRWSADVNKVARAQGANVTEAPPIGIGEDAITSSAEEEADRALQTVRKKLDVQLSVEYAVNKLIQDATSPVFLGTIFRGWNATL